MAELLMLLADSGRRFSLAELARRLAVPKASLADLLSGLVACGFVSRNGDLFALGPSALSFARRAVAHLTFTQIAHHHLEQLAREVNETALVAQLDEETMTSVITDKVEGEYPVRYSVPIGLRRELHATSAGKVFLAHLPPGRLLAYLGSRQLEAFTPETITDVERLREELAAIKAAGVGDTKDERTLDASGLAVPFFGEGDSLLRVLIVAGVTSRISSKRLQVREALKAAARKLSDEARDLRPQREQSSS